MIRLIPWLVFFFLTSLYANAQILNQGFEDLFDPSTHPITVNEKGVKIESHVSLEKFPKNTNGECFYHWHHANKIMKTQGGYGGNLLHGDYNSFYKNGQLKESGRFVLGLKHGKWTEWTSDGYIYKIVHWNKGIRHGETIEYDGNGEIMSIITFANGEIIDPEKLSKREKKRLFGSFNYDIGRNDY